MFETKKFNLKKFTQRLISAFAIILFWKGAWGIVDQYFGNDLNSNLSSIIIGIALLIIDDYSIKELV